MMSEECASLVRIDFDPLVYRLTAIKQAAYRFGDRCFIEIAIDDGQRVWVTLKSKSDDISADHWADEFRNAVLDQELREQVAIETAGIRNLLLAQAFSATSLIQPESAADPGFSTREPS